MSNLVKQQNNYCNVTQWQEVGYTGKGINIWNCEGFSNHGYQTTQRILEVLPNATIYNASINMSRKNGIVKDISVNYEGICYTMEEFIVKFKIKLLTQSNHGYVNEPDEQYVKYLQGLKEKYNLVFINLSGNELQRSNENQCNGSFPHEVAIWVGACSLVKGTPKYITQFCNGQKKDFVDFMGDYRGTSYSAPYLCAKIGMLVNRYGLDMTQEEVFKYLQYHCLDMSKTGRDIYNGWGLPILPDINKKYITMTIGEKQFNSNGVIKNMDVTPIQKDYRTFVPLRFLSEDLGFKVDWNEENKQATVFKDKVTIVFTLDSKKIIVNGLTVEMDVAPFMFDYRTMIPVRACEYLGLAVDWIESEKKIMLLEM